MRRGVQIHPGPILVQLASGWARGAFKLAAQTFNRDVQRCPQSLVARQPGRRRSTHVRASWHGATLAETHDTIVVEGNHYFPPDSIDRHFFRDSSERSVCPWKGLASYFDVVVDGEVNAGAAWYYPEPKAAAAQIKDRVAFWRGVRVERVPTAETASPAD